MPLRCIGGTPCPWCNHRAGKRHQNSQPWTTTLFLMGGSQEALLSFLSSETTFSELTATHPRWILESSPASLATSSASWAPATGHDHLAHDRPAQDGVAAAGDRPGDRDAARGTLFPFLLCTGIYSCVSLWYIISQNYTSCEHSSWAGSGRSHSNRLRMLTGPPSHLLPGHSGSCSFPPGRGWTLVGDKHPHSPPHRACPTVPTTSLMGRGTPAPAPARHGALACIFSRQLAQKATSRLSRLPQKSVKSFSSRSANLSSPVALERQVLVSMVL